MERISVSSSNIFSIGYDAQSRILEIEFTSNEVYQYFDVPENLYNGLMSASSKGQFLNDYIKYSYRYQKIR
ncbi:KTSC domain-containing protein [Patescibacteria group bacterium]|nr:KTSC domain-containing protein [Patescibacteria group bacterium]